MKKHGDRIEEGTRNATIIANWQPWQMVLSDRDEKNKHAWVFKITLKKLDHVIISNISPFSIKENFENTSPKTRVPIVKPTSPNLWFPLSVFSGVSSDLAKPIIDCVARSQFEIEEVHLLFIIGRVDCYF